MNIGKLIHDRRIELGLTLEDVGNVVHVGKSTVKKWEDGFISNMKRDKIALLAKALQIDPVTLITGDIADIHKQTVENNIEEDVIIYHRNGKTVKKKMSKSQMDLLTSMLDAIPDDCDL